MRIALMAAAVLAGLAAHAFGQGRAVTPDTIETVTLHPLHQDHYACMEHRDGELEFLGDALGTDCVIQGGLADGGFVSSFRGDGASNEDWYGWAAEVLAPFDGAVMRVHINPETNAPGQVGRPPASFILFQRADGVLVLFAHVQDVQVEQGEIVRAGQFVARVGNNGYGRNPHIHVGAWKDQTPYQIRWNLRRTSSE